MVTEFDNYEDLVAEAERGELHIGLFEKLDDKSLQNINRLFEEHTLKEVYILSGSFEYLKDILPLIKSDKVYIINNWGPFKYYYLLDDYKYIMDNYDNIYFLSKENEASVPYYRINKFRAGIFSAKQMYETEKMIEFIISEVSKKDFSPLEKYAYLYNITKMIKPYNKGETSDYWEKSTYTEYILDNEYIVCSGYSLLLERLVSKLNDSNITAWKEYTDNHARLLTIIEDDKYNISGIYISDPTNDNNKAGNIDNDYYNYFLITPEELADHKFMGDNQHSIISLIAKDRHIANYDLATRMLDSMHAISHLLYNKPDIRIDEFRQLMREIDLDSTPIDADTIKNVISTIYPHIYIGNDEYIQSKIDSTMKKNNERQQKLYNQFANKFASTVKTK